MHGAERPAGGCRTRNEEGHRKEEEIADALNVSRRLPSGDTAGIEQFTETTHVPF